MCSGCKVPVDHASRIKVILISMGYINLVSSDLYDARKFAWTGPFRNAFRVGLDC